MKEWSNFENFVEQWTLLEYINFFSSLYHLFIRQREESGEIAIVTKDTLSQ